MVGIGIGLLLLLGGLVGTQLSAHSGNDDPDSIHACVKNVGSDDDDDKNGTNIRIVGLDEECKKNERTCTGGYRAPRVRKVPRVPKVTQVQLSSRDRQAPKGLRESPAPRGR